MFFATIVAAPLLGENSAINEVAISSFREGVFKCMLLGTLHLEVASITCQALCYSAVIAVPQGSMALWLSKRVGAVQFVLCLHMCSFYAFIATIVLFPLLTRHDNASLCMALGILCSRSNHDSDHDDTAVRRPASAHENAFAPS